jgi:hypothetical protein
VNSTWPGRKSATSVCWALYLDDELGLAEDTLRVRDDRRALRLVGGIADRRALARLDHHLMAVSEQLPNAGRCEADAVLIRVGCAAPAAS